MISANEHYDRSVITKLAIEQSLKKEKVEGFDSITYIGDGLWDLKTTQELGIDFIGVDYHQNQKLSIAGAGYVVNNFSDLETIINTVNRCKF